MPLDVDGVCCSGNFNDCCEQEMDVPLQLGDNERINAALTAFGICEVTGDKNGLKQSFCALLPGG